MTTPLHAQTRFRTQVNRRWRWAAAAALPCVLVAAAAAADPATDFADLSLEDLLEVRVTEVTSASRQALPAHQSSVPVSVVTSDDVRYGARTTLAELLQFVPGVDVLMPDRNAPAVGVRGLHDQFSNRTLLLIDNRMAENAALGAVELQRTPLILEDIERIEVVRGPSAAWGANAFNGVINIITKDPEDTQGLAASTTLSEFGSTYNQLRYGGTLGPDDEAWAYRVSLGYEDLVDSEDATTGDNFASDDFRRHVIVGLKAARGLSPDTRLTLDAGVGVYEAGSRERGALAPDDDDHTTRVRLGAKLEHDFDPDVSGYLQWFATVDDARMPNLTDVTAVVNDVEGQLNLDLRPGHHLAVGGNVRWTHIDPHENDNGFSLGGRTFNEITAGVFAIDRRDLTPRITVESQARLDYNSDIEESLDWSARLTGLYALDAAKDHVLRISGARAFRTPAPLLRVGSVARVPLPSPPFAPGSNGFNLNPNPDLKNEVLYSFEGGYAAQISSEWSARVDGYLQHYEDLVTTPVTLVGPVAQVSNSANDGSADVIGFETELAWERGRTRIAGWYAFSDFDIDERNPRVRGYLPAAHKAGLNARFALDRGLIFSTNYRYTGLTRGDTLPQRPDVESQHLVDLVLTVPLASRGEFSVGVADVFDAGDVSADSFGDSNLFTNNHPVPGQTFFARLRWTY